MYAIRSYYVLLGAGAGLRPLAQQAVAGIGPLLDDEGEQRNPRCGPELVDPEVLQDP